LVAAIKEVYKVICDEDETKSERLWECARK